MKRFVWLIVPMVLLAGCGMPKSAKETTPMPVTPSTGAMPSPGDGGQNGTSNPAAGSIVNGIQLDQYGRPVNRLIYFDYDKSDIKVEYRTLLEAHARYLAANPQFRARLEGHADERGSREYNLALGERRAYSVQRMMTIYGSSAGQMDMFSYGEEKPMRAEHSESAWSENRRVEIVYLGGN